jgi:hypothetical protein
MAQQNQWTQNWYEQTTVKLNHITWLLNQLIRKETKMAIDLTGLTAEVARNTTVTASVGALLDQLTALIKAIPPSTDPVTQAALTDLVNTLTANDAVLTAAVTANTPAAPASGSKR